MPVAHLMSWEPTRRRWWKMQDGKRYIVSVRQLRKHFKDPSIPETKDGSSRWANRWWEETSQLPKQAPKHPLVEIDGLIIDNPVFADVVLAWSYQQAGLPLPNGLTDAIIGKSRREELERGVEKLLDRGEVDLDRSVGHQVDLYLNMQYQRYKAQQISVSEYSNAKSGLNSLRGWLGTSTAVDVIDADRWQRYYLHLLTDGPKSVVTKRKFFRFARNFLTWLSDLGVHPAPPNLDRRQYRFKGGSPSVRTMDIETVKKAISQATGQLKLHILLMLNCGFTQVDISDLHPSEVDWELGRIKRKRSKTGDHANVPFVDYPLWSETFELLKKYRSKSPDRVLLTQNGKAWVRDEIHPDGSRSRTDAIQSNWRKLAKLGPLKIFRKVSASLLDGSSEHGRYSVHFLGHAADVAHRHYIHSNGFAFDQAVMWLGEQLGY